MTSQQLQLCFDQIIKNPNLEGIRKAVDQFKKIEAPVLEPFKLSSHAPSLPLQSLIKHFVPAPDLLRSYQETFTQANQNERIVNTTNYKLKSSFGQPAPKKNTYEAMASRTNAMLDQPVMVQDREQVFLQRLRKKQIEATIPNMEQTLFQNQLEHLQRKAVGVEHTLPLSEWKKLRAMIDKK